MGELAPLVEAIGVWGSGCCFVFDVSVVLLMSNVSSIPHPCRCGIGLDIGHETGNVQRKAFGLALDMLDMLAVITFSALDSFRRPASVIR